MKLVKVSDVSGGAAASLQITCVSCGFKAEYSAKWENGEGWYSDLEGKPFKAYYCPMCAQKIKEVRTWHQKT